MSRKYEVKKYEHEYAPLKDKMLIKREGENPITIEPLKGVKIGVDEDCECDVPFEMDLFDEVKFKTTPTIKKSRMSNGLREVILESLKSSIKLEILRKEDQFFIDALIKKCKKINLVKQKGELTIAALNYAFGLIEQSNLTVAKIIMHPRQYADIRLFGRDVCDEPTRRDVLMSGLFGHLWTADIHVSSRICEGKVLLLAPSEMVGFYEEVEPLTIKPFEDKVGIGFKAKEELIYSEFNENAIAVIHLENPPFVKAIDADADADADADEVEEVTSEKREKEKAMIEDVLNKV